MKQQPMARKLLALCLSLLLVLALSPTAWADPTEGSETPAPTETAPANTAPAEEETTTTDETLEEKCVALIGEDEYTDLAKAFEDAAESGATITLVSDVTLEETIKLTSGEVTLDLSEKTISGSASTLFELSGGAKLTVDNGTITAGKDAFSVYGDQTFAQANPVNTKLTLGSGLTVTSGSNCVYIRGASAQAVDFTVRQAVRWRCRAMMLRPIAVRSPVNGGHPHAISAWGCPPRGGALQGAWMCPRLPGEVCA